MSSRVLIVDDEPDILFMIKVILRSEGYDVVAAAGVEEARAQLSDDDPDLVLLDLRLADGEGWDVLRQLREAGRLKRVPVVVLSAHASPTTIRRALDEGAAGYVTKPFVTSELVGAVRQYAYPG
jgi:two-component system KDP operon response regulator KdpE